MHPLERGPSSARSELDRAFSWHGMVCQMVITSLLATFLFPQSLGVHRNCRQACLSILAIFTKSQVFFPLAQ